MMNILCSYLDLATAHDRENIWNTHSINAWDIYLHLVSFWTCVWMEVAETQERTVSTSDISCPFAIQHEHHMYKNKNFISHACVPKKMFYTNFNLVCQRMNTSHSSLGSSEVVTLLSLYNLIRKNMSSVLDLLLRWLNKKLTQTSYQTRWWKNGDL